MMDVQPSEQQIEILLKELQHDTAHRRVIAIETVQKHNLKEPRITARLSGLASEDSVKLVRDAAAKALASLDENRPTIPLPETVLAERYKPGFSRHFWYGFVGWWAVNGAFYALTGAELVYAMLLCFVNPIVALAFGFGPPRNKDVAFGIVAAMALNFFISLVMGSLINGICFVPFFNGFDMS